MALFGDGEPTREELLAQQQKQERQRTERQTANDLARSAAQQGGEAKPGYWDVLTNPDIESGIESYDEHIDAFHAAELSGQLTIGNITREDWKAWQWRVEYESWMSKNEFKDPDCDLDAIDMLTMYGSDKPVLTNSRARKMRSVEHIRKMMLSNSIDARGQRSGTEIHAVARTEDGSNEDGDDGGSGGIRGWLST